jgi:hypothetical protein
VTSARFPALNTGFRAQNAGDRAILAGMMAVALIAAGCSSSSATQATTSTTSSAPSATSPSAQAGALDTDTCWDISSDKDDLMVADNPEKARAAADALEKYSPPHLVKNAIEHFVTTLGAQADDPDNSSMAYLLNDWVQQLCPMWPNP